MCHCELVSVPSPNSVLSASCVGHTPISREWLCTLADGRVAFVRVRSGHWTVAAGSSVHDAIWPGASDPALRARLGWDWPAQMHFDGQVLGSGELADPSARDEDLAQISAGLLGFEDCRWLAPAVVDHLEEVAGALRAAAGLSHP